MTDLFVEFGGLVALFLLMVGAALWVELRRTPSQKVARHAHKFIDHTLLATFHRDAALRTEMRLFAPAYHKAAAFWHERWAAYHGRR